ncbi:uncharacterized protein LOC142362188 isoform X2 [Opisthocomus hoazin]|uniref:uncharacterized protein LOC142362188 isoform X2 n=1 Tax=Opisthocomus hoazin TaxID=30419 RepID=UPI003F52CF07
MTVRSSQTPRQREEARQPGNSPPPGLPHSPASSSTLQPDHFIAIQRARSSASSHGACPTASASRAPSPWGDKPICLPCSQAAIPGTLCAPQAPLASSEPQTHPGPGRGPGFSQFTRKAMPKDELMASKCYPIQGVRLQMASEKWLQIPHRSSYSIITSFSVSTLTTSSGCTAPAIQQRSNSPAN